MMNSITNSHKNTLYPMSQFLGVLWNNCINKNVLRRHLLLWPFLTCQLAFAQQGNLPCNALNSTPFIPPTIAGTLSQTTSTSGVGAAYWESNAGCVLGLPLGCGSTHIPANVINSSTTDYATAHLAVGLGLSATMRVTEATNTYSAGNFAGYLIDNASLVSAGLLNAITVKTYNNGTLAETSSSGSLIGVSSTLVTGKYEIGFYTTQPFDAIEITFNSVVGLAVNYDVYYPVVRRYCAGPTLVCNTKTVLNKNATPALSFPVEIEYAHTGISGVAIATITNPESAISQSTTDFASVVFPIGIGSAHLAVKDHFTSYTAGHFVGFDIENVTALGVGLFNSTIITTYLNGVQRETASGSSLAISAGLLSGSGRQTVGFVSTMSFDEIKITLNQNGLSLGTTKIYGAVFQKFCAATIACNQTYSLSNPDYPVLIDGALTGLSGVACVGCSVSNTENLITANTTDYATITVLAGLGASGAIAVQDALYTYPAGTTAGFTIKDVNTLVQLDLFNALTISTYNNGVLQESKTAGNLLDFALLTNWVGLGSGAYNIGFMATLPFDEMRLSVGSLASALNIIQVYGAYVNTATSNGGSLSCAASFNFNCGTAASTGIFEANNVGGQTGTLTLPLTNTTAGGAVFTVIGTGFSGTLSTNLTVGQGSVVIPIIYNGTGASGSRTLTVSSMQGIGTCSPSVSVVGGCPLSLPVLSALGISVSIPNFYIKGNYNYYKVLATACDEFLAINLNGNVFQPTKTIVDATVAGTHSITSGSYTTTLAKRMISIEAPGSFTGNGGLKVRIYYDPSEFSTLPVSRRWFKHPAHTKANVLADLTPTGLTNAVFLTPDSIGIENGLSFVEFFNIQSFSTFGYMGSAAPEDCTNGIDDDGDGLIDCNDPDCGKPSVSAISKTDPSVSSCPNLNDGSISITATGSNLRYSKNGGTNWQVSNTFNSLTGGTTTIRIQDSLSTCSLDTAIVLTAPTCVTCATPSVGGTASYTGGTVCSTANLGTITLTGQTGDVVKWQTSTNGGTTWTDMAGTATKTTYNFINTANNQQYRAIVNTDIANCTEAVSTVVTITTSSTACTTNTCSYTSGTFNPSIATTSNPTYTSHVILVNPTNGQIEYVTSANSTAFTSVVQGDYIMYAVTYDNTIAPIPTFTVGTNISTLNGCFAVSDPLLTKVCINQAPTITSATTGTTPENVSTTTTIYTATATDPNAGQTQTYYFETGGADNALFTINPTTGAVTFNASPNFENPLDAGGNNVYNIKIKTCDNGSPQLCAIQDVAITMTDVLDTEICNNQLDDDNDGKIDGEDPDCTEPNCDNTTGIITATIAGQNTGSSFTQKYVLTDSTGKILQIVNTPSVSVTISGKYRVYGVNYETTTGITGLTVNQNITSVTGTCVNISLPLLYKVCYSAPVEICGNQIDDDNDGKIDGEDPDCTEPACDNTTGIITATIAGQNTNASFTQKYVLTDSTGKILQIVNTPSVSGLISGKFRFYSVNYETASGITGFSVNQNITAVTGSCVNKSLPLLYKICVPLCPNPAVGGTTSTTALPVCSTLNAGSITLTGHTGAIVKWQTSTNGGSVWTDISNTTTILSFSNATNNQQYRAIVSTGGVCANDTSTITSITTDPNVCCNSTDGTISATYSGFSTEPTHKNKFALTDTTGRILQITNTPQYSSLNTGWYQIYAITYDTLGVIKGLMVGADIDTLNGECLLKTAPIPYKVCRFMKPVLSDSAFTVWQDTTVNLCLKIVDASGGVVTHTTNILVSPLHGSVSNISINHASQQLCFNYTSDSLFMGQDSFKIQVCNNGNFCDTATIKINIVAGCVSMQLKVLLEGAYQTTTSKMTTILNQRGLLPGQTSIGQFALATPSGQPYKGAPWNYAGMEGDTITTYPPTVTDWVLLTLRTDTLSYTPLYRVAGWLHEDGTITFPQGCTAIPNGSYFVLIEHRNHMGVLSYRKVSIENRVMNFDFTTTDSYIRTNPPSFGQKLKGGKWMMYGGDGKKDTFTTNFDINFNDTQLWKGQSGTFDQYKFGDFNLDADVNFLDNQLWKLNNGKYSGVPH